MEQQDKSKTVRGDAWEKPQVIVLRADATLSKPQNNEIESQFDSFGPS